MTDTRDCKSLMWLVLLTLLKGLRVNAWIATALDHPFLPVDSPICPQARPGGKIEIAALAPTTRVYTKPQNWRAPKSWGAGILGLS